MTERKHYVSKKDLNAEIMKYKESADPKITKELGTMLRLIAEHYVRHPNFRNYSFEMKEDLISEGLLMCFKALKSYKPIKDDGTENNCVAYFTECVKNAFKSFLSKHYKTKNFEREMLKEYCDENYIPFRDLIGEDLAERAAEKESKF